MAACARSRTCSSFASGAAGRAASNTTESVRDWKRDYLRTRCTATTSRGAVLCLFGSSGGACAVGCPVTAGLPATASCLLAAAVPLRGRRHSSRMRAQRCSAFKRFEQQTPSAFYSPRGPLRVWHKTNKRRHFFEDNGRFLGVSRVGTALRREGD